MTDILSEERKRSIVRSFGRESANRSAFSLSAAPEPEAATEAVTLGDELGVPPAAVTGAPDVFKTQAAQKRASTALTNAPRTSVWLADPINAGLAKDDLDNLTSWEAFAAAGGGLRDTALVRAGERGGRTVAAAPAAVGATIDAQILADAGKTAQEIYKEELKKLGPNALPQHRATAMQTAQARYETAQGLSEEEIKGLLARGARDLLSHRDQMAVVEGLERSATTQDFLDNNLAKAKPGLLGAIRPFIDNPVGGAAFIAETAAEFIPIMLASTGVTAVTRSPVMGAASMGIGSAAMENASEASNFLAGKGITIETAEDAMAVLQDAELMAELSDRALTRGAFIGMFDAISGGVAGKALAKSPVSDAMMQGVVQAAMGGGGEAAAQLALGDDFDWTEVVVEALAELATMPVEVLGVGGRAFLRDTNKVRRAGEAKEALARVEQMAVESLVRQRAPAKFKEALEAQGLDGVSVYVPADGLREYFQAKDVPFEAGMLEAYGLDPQTFEELADSGTDVAVPLSAFASNIAGTEDAAWISDNAVFEPGEMSEAQAKAFNASVTDVMAQAYAEAEAEWQAQREMRADDVQVQDAVRIQLREAGVSPDVAENQSQVWGAFFRVMSERYGEPALDLARRFGVRIVGPQSEETRRRGNLDIALGTLRKTGVPVTGRTLSQFVKDEGGIQDRGGNVAAMDAPGGIIAESYADIRDRESQPVMPGAMPSEGKGSPIEEMARKAAEAGYFPELMDEATRGIKGEASDFVERFVEALRDDIAGNPVYVVDEGLDLELQRLQDELDRRGIDLALSNDEIAAALEGQGGAVFEQAPSVESDAFKAWAGTDEILEPDEINDADFSGRGPFVMRVYHGTTHEIDAFDASKYGNKEGQFGAVNYFTTSESDASSNYGGVGPDLTNRIEQRAEPLADELTDLYESLDEDDGAYQAAIADMYGEEFAGFEDMMEAARAIIQSEMHGGNEQVLEVLVRTDKPFVVGGDSPFIEFVDFDALEQMAIARVAEGNGVAIDDVDANRDDYEDQIDEARWDIEAEDENPLASAIERVAMEYGLDAGEIFASVSDFANEGGQHSDIEAALRESEGLQYAEDPETGGLVGYHVLAEIIRELGFDSIILRNAGDRFASMDIVSGTAHIHVFDENNSNIKSVDNRGTFDPQDPRILYQANAEFASYHEAKAEADRLLDEVKNGGDAKEAFAAFGRQAEKRGELAQAIANEAGGIELTNERGDLFAAVTKSQAVDDGWRVTFFNDSGFLGHTEQPTKLAAVQQALDEGYTAESEGALRQAMKAKTFFQPAWHGTPHAFDKFSTDHIGTGEGAQAFGWGLYFAGDKTVAQIYRDKLTPAPGVEAGPYVSHHQYRQAVFEEVTKRHPEIDRAEVARMVGNATRGYWIRAENKTQSDPVLMNAFLDSKEKFETGLADSYGGNNVIGPTIVQVMRELPMPQWVEDKGRLFRVDVPEDSELLDFDETIAEQEPGIEEKFRKAMLSLDRPISDDFYGFSSVSDMLDDMDYSGNSVGYYLVLMPKFGFAPKEISLALNEAGIPGHRFLDGMSRRSGEGSYNYVVYSDEAIKVLDFEQDAYGSIQFPARGIEGGETVINLFQTDNLSTFLHEAGHYMLEAFTALANDEAAPAGMKEDLARIRDYLGNKGEALTTEQHETFARSFEAYLLEGKAPSYELAPAFARFKAWLVQIYKSVRGLNVPINDEIRGVFDRMLATEAEIKAVRDDMAAHPLFREAPANMSPTDWATYQRMARRTQERGEERLLKKTMAKVRNERTKWYRAEKKAVQAEVTDEFNKRREYRLVDLIANKVWIGSDRAVPDMQIDKAALVEMFGEGVLNEISRSQLGGKRAVYGPNGSHPSEVADFFGFASASEMVDVLQNTTKKRDAIKAEVERRMDERHGDPLNDGSIEEEALAAIHNDAQANLATTEARHLAKQLGRDASMVRTKIYRQRARMMIGRMAVGQASKPATFLAAERRAAREAEAAMAKVARGTGGQEALARAFQAKEQQILNGFLFNESRKVEATIGKVRERMRSYDKAKVREKLAGGYIEQIDALLEGYDFRVRSKKAVARSASLRLYIAEMATPAGEVVVDIAGQPILRADGSQIIGKGRAGELAIDPRLMDESHRKHYTKLSVDELNGLVDTITNIDHMGRFKQKLIDAQKKRDFDETVGTVVDAIGDNLKPATRTRKSGTRKAAESLRAALNTLLTADSIIADIDASEFGGFYQAIKADIDRGQSRETLMQKEMAEKLDELFAVYSAKEISEMQRLRSVDGAPREMAKWEIIAAALNTGNDDNMQRLLTEDVPKSERITPDMLEAMLDTLDKRDWDFVQSMWDMIDGYAKEAFDVEERRTGVRPKKVEGRPVKTKFGIYRGGYYPIKYDGDATSNARMDEKSAWDKFQSAGRAGKAQTKNGHLQERKSTGNGRVLNLDMTVAFGHLRDVVHGIALSEAVDNAHRVLNDPRVGAAFIEKGRVQDQDSLNLWLKDLAQGPMRSQDWMNRLARTVKNNFTLSRLAFNMKTTVLQATGLGQSAVTIGKRNMLNGLMQFYRAPRETTGMVLEASPFMRERSNTFQKDIYDFANDLDTTGPMQGRYQKAKQWLGKAGFYQITVTQFYAVDMPTWLGAYAQATKDGRSDADAILYADGMVRKAQGSGLMADMPGASRGTLSERTRQNDVVRLLTTLGGYMMTKLNRAHMTAIKARRDMRAADGALEHVSVAMNATTDFALLYLLEGAMMAIGYGLMTDDDEPEDYATFIGSEAVAAFFGGIPVVREIASPYGGGGIYGTMTDAPLNMVEQIMQGDADKAARRSVFDMAGIVTGLPTTFLERALNGAVDDDTSPAEALFGRNPMEDK